MNEVMQIWDYVNTPNIATYWLENTIDMPPLPGEQLFGTRKQLGLKLSFIKGATGIPSVLKLSAFDAEAVPRPRIGFEAFEHNMPFFKESMYIDEELRQELLMLLQTGNQAYINTVMSRVFNDAEQLLLSARVSRERMRMQLLTTGTIVMSSNGQNWLVDYQQPDENFITSTYAWSDAENADAIADIESAQELIRNTYGVEINRVMLNTVTFNKLRLQDSIRNSYYVINALVEGTGRLTDGTVRSYFSSLLGVEFIINDKRYVDDNKATQKYVPDDVVVIMPSGTMGDMWFGTTPEEADLMSGAAQAQVAIVDTGVAVTSYKHVDPVNVNIKVSQVCMPSYEAGNYVVVLDVSDDAERPTDPVVTPPEE